MTIGLSTYAYFWRSHAEHPAPMGLEEMLRDAADHGIALFQICDYAPLDSLGPEGLRALRERAEGLGIALELGTRGTDPAHVRRYAGMARALGARILRSMWTSGEDCPSPEETVRRLRAVLPALEEAGVTLALETYERVSTARLIAAVEEVAHPRVGICLDPANTVARFENPLDVAARCAARTVNWHVKDAAFSREPGWVGFRYTGTALGEGEIDIDGIRALLRPEERGISEIIEFWLPPSGSPEDTARREVEWTEQAINYLRRTRRVSAQ